MRPVEPAELSALLDGELPPDRAGEVRAAIAQDPQWRRAFDELVVLDADWRARASAATFRPRVHLDEVAGPETRASGRWLLPVAAVMALVALRLAMKFQPPLLEVGVEAVLLTALIGWGVRRIFVATDADRARLAIAP